MKNLKRVYRHIDDWEEVHFGMWDPPKDKKRQMTQAINFTSNHKLYGSYMMRVATEWAASCENALTDYNLNRKAWVGHAACALALRLPESVVREAWGKLTYEQQLLANDQADRAIKVWERNYRKSNGLLEHVGGSLL